MALTALAEFTASLTLASDGIPNAADELRHYYRMEEASGTAFDVRGPSGDLDQGTAPGTATGKIGSARDFVRASSHDLTTNDNELWYLDGAHDFTITCWAAVDTASMAGGDGAVYGRFDGPGGDRGPLLFFDTSAGTLRFVMSLNGTSNAVDLEPTLTLTGGQLYFLEVRYNSSTRLLEFRINRGSGATFEDSATVGAGTWHKTTVNFFVGDATGTADTHLDGRVDELTLHGRRLSDAELDAIYNEGEGLNLNSFLDRDFSFSMSADANFQVEGLVVFEFDANVQIDADFDASLILAEKAFACSVSADADFTSTFEAERTIVSAFEADAEFTTPLSRDFDLLAPVTVDASFQMALEVFDVAYQVAMEVEANFAEDLTVTVDVQIQSDFQADADFLMLLEIADRELRSSMTADADFVVGLSVERGLLSDLTADADFTMVFDTDRVPLMQLFSADANFQVSLVYVESLYSFSFGANADFEADLFTGEVDAYLDDFLGITNQLEDAGLRAKVAGISSNLDPTVLDTQWLAATPYDDDLEVFDSPNLQIMAEHAAVAPAPATATNHDAYLNDLLSAGGDWFGNVYVLPTLVEAGFVITEQIIPMQVYNSSKTVTRSLDSTANNVDSGVSLDSFPILPESIAPQAGFPFVMVISPDGPPVIDGTFDFTFDGPETLSVTVTGDRTIMFSLQPESNQAFTERLTFLTEIIRRRDEREQRIALRKTPRQVFEAEFKLVGVESQLLNALLFDKQSSVLGFPVWFEPSALTSAITAGDSVVNVNSTDFGDFRDGGLFTVWESATKFEVLQISSHTATTITATGVFGSDHPITAKVYPVRIGYLNRTVDGARFLVNLQQTKVVFRVLDNESDLSDASAFPTFNGKVLIDDPNMVRRDQLSESWAKTVQVIDNNTGTFRIFSNAELSRRGHSKTFLSLSRERLWEVRQLLHSLRGRQTSFYLPTFSKEFSPTIALTSGSDTLTFENFGYVGLIQSRKPRDVIRVVLKDGTILTRTIIDATIISEDEEQIQVDAAWGVDAALDEIDYVDYLTLVRLDSDEVVFTHRKALGEAEIQFPVLEVVE